MDATSTHKDTQKCNKGLKNEERDQATNSYRKSPKYSDTQNIAPLGAVWSGTTLIAQTYLS